MVFQVKIIKDKERERYFLDNNEGNIGRNFKSANQQSGNNVIEVVKELPLFLVF